MFMTSCATDSIKVLPQSYFTSGHGQTAVTMPLTKKFVLAVQVFLLAITGIRTSCNVCLGPRATNASADTRPQSRSTFTPGMLDTPLQDLRMSVTSCATDSIKALPQNYFTSKHGETAATMPLTKKFVLAVQATGVSFENLKDTFHNTLYTFTWYLPKHDEVLSDIFLAAFDQRLKDELPHLDVVRTFRIEAGGERESRDVI
ncbi:uncharacterized protein LOC142783996 [Rhipicephalus microplus]|uniref:uncharacterized protein LOC142783996 n=1 Tax=Rhipicephalus microplus TaxID=6941 RepID=UPI003F6CD49D